MNPRVRTYGYSILGAIVGLIAAYVFTFMRYGEAGLFIGKFVLILCCGALCGWIIGLKIGRRMLGRHLVRVSITVAAIVALTVLIGHWAYS